MAYTNFTCGLCGVHALAFEAPYLLVLMTRSEFEVISQYANDVLQSAWREAKKEGNQDPIPPRLPPELYALKRRKGTWEQVDFHDSMKMPAPIDPIRIEHDQFWAEVFAELKIRRDQVKEIPNQYYDDHLNNEPWYEMTLGGANVIFGPRKRVIEIKVGRDEPFSVTWISEKAKKDNVTYIVANGNPGTDSWHAHDAKEATGMTVHAWGKKKFISYFKSIMLDLELGPPGENIKAV